MNRRGFIGAVVGAGVAIRTKALSLFDWTKPAPLPYENINGRPMYYDRRGLPLRDVHDWARLFGDRSYKLLAWTHLPNGYWVSTIWLGLDHSFSRTGPPLIFESMAFEEKLSYAHPTTIGSYRLKGFLYHESKDEQRYHTETEALRGHWELCERICPGSLTLG